MNLKKGKEHYKNHRFPGQKPGDSIQLLIRKHWIIDFKIGMMFLVIGFLPFLTAIIGGYFAWDGHFNDLFLIISLIFLLYFMVILLVTYVKWLNEELDIIVVTDTRIISHEQIDLFHRQVSEANLGQIQDITGVSKGFLQSYLHYGDLEIQTSASDIFFMIKNINYPYESARTLLDMRDNLTPKHD